LGLAVGGKTLRALVGLYARSDFTLARIQRVKAASSRVPAVSSKWLSGIFISDKTAAVQFEEEDADDKAIRLVRQIKGDYGQCHDVNGGHIDDVRCFAVGVKLLGARKC
jgi:hypothetical protein